MTPGLKSWVCLGGRCGRSSCNLWTEPGLVVPGKTTARLEGWRQLDTFPPPDLPPPPPHPPANRHLRPQAASENPKMTNALPNSRGVEGERQVPPERAHCAGWGVASRWAGSTCSGLSCRQGAAKFQVRHVPPDTWPAPRLNVPPFHRAPWWRSEDDASNINKLQGPAGLASCPPSLPASQPRRRRIEHRKRSCGHRPGPGSRPPNVSTSSGCAGN